MTTIALNILQDNAVTQNALGGLIIINYYRPTNNVLSFCKFPVCQKITKIDRHQ